MLRTLVLTGVMCLAVAAPANAVLVYQQPASGKVVPETDASGAIVAARNDGTLPRVIAHGTNPVVSPNGRWVGFFQPISGGGDQFRLVSVSGGHAKLVIRRVFRPYPNPGLTWSADGRQLVVGAVGGAGAYIVAVPRGSRRYISLSDEFTGGSFAPGDATVAIDVAGLRDETLVAVSLPPHRGRRVIARNAGNPVWSKHGLAYGGTQGLIVKRHLDTRTRVLIPPRFPVPFPIAWSTSGGKLLAARTLPGRDRYLALIVGPRTRALTTLPPVFEEVTGFSHDGRDVLGVVSGNVVATALTGTSRILAQSATDPSWSK